MEAASVQPPSTAPTLPRVIHQTWKHRHVRWPLSHCVASFRKWNLGWEFRLWTDEKAEELIAAELPDFLSTYRAFAPGILRADIFRIAVLYIRGGVYADLDMECLRPLDELLAAAGDDDWEVMLARDHPCHERLHYNGRPMWLNAIMLAKPGSVFFARVLTELDMMAADGRVKGDAVGLTGPGLLTGMIERHENDFAGLAIRVVPWEWLHPLPNVFVRFPERPMYRRLIRTREWRDGKQVELDAAEGGWRWTERPFAAHYWWHSYIGECRDKNMLERYAPSLLQSDGDIVETRLQTVAGNGSAITESLATALATFAERGCGTILQVGDLPLPPHCLNRLMDETLKGFDWKIAALPASASASERAVEIKAGLVVAGELSIERLAEVMTAMQQQGKSLLLIPSVLAETELLKSRIAAGQWQVLASDDLCLLDVARGNKAVIPEVLHLPVCSSSERRAWRLSGIHSRLQEWHLAFQRSGWKSRIWKMEDVVELIGNHAPELLDALWPVDDFAAFWRQAKIFIAAWEGGLVADTDLLCLRPFAALLGEQRLLLSTHRKNDAIHANDLVIASEQRHRFWDGIESDALRWLGIKPGKALGTEFLAARAKDASRFLRKEDWPSLAEPDWFGASLADAPRLSAPWKIRASVTLENLFPQAFAIKV